MKKIVIALFTAMTIFAFTACPRRILPPPPPPPPLPKRIPLPPPPPLP